MFKFIGALLVGILSASLAVIYQNDIAAFLGRAPVTVRVTAGGWYPHSQNSDPKQRFSGADESNIASYGNTKESDFARVTISNNTGRDIPNAYIKYDDEDNIGTWKFDAVILRKLNGNDERFVIDDVADRIDVGLLPAAQDTTVYLWTNRGFGYPFGVGDLEVLTTDSAARKTVTQVEGTSDELLLGVSTETVAWGFVFSVILIAGLLLLSIAQTYEFVKRMFADEDYYLSERLRYEADPKKYTPPSK